MPALVETDDIEIYKSLIGLQWREGYMGQSMEMVTVAEHAQVYTG